jgi:hypothetical protein
MNESISARPNTGVASPLAPAERCNIGVIQKVRPSGYSNAVLTSLEQTVAHMTGVTVTTLRDQTLDERRKMLESQHGQPMKFISKFPFIGRGNVLRNKIVSGAEVNALLDQALR